MQERWSLDWFSWRFVLTISAPEYAIYLQSICTPPNFTKTPEYDRLPSPIKRPEIKEIYNYRVEKDCIYVFDRRVEERTVGLALKVFLDAAFTSNKSVKIIRTETKV
jgi:hypothetical protein